MKKLFLLGILATAAGVLLYTLVLSKKPAAPAENPEAQRSVPPAKIASISSEGEKAAAVPKAPSSGAPYLDRFLAEFNEAVENEDNEKMELLMKEFTRRDPEAAATFAMSLIREGPRSIALRCVARVWAELSPEKALKWAATLGKDQDNNERRFAEGFICGQIAETDPQAAMKWAGTAGYGNDSGLMGSFATQWAMRDMNSALAWTLKQPQNEGRDNLLHGVLFELAKTDPARAAQLISSQMGNSAGGAYKEETTIQILPYWGVKDPAAAARWVAQLPPGEFRKRAEEALTQKPLEDNPPVGQ
jgi:hypothetical protein